MRQAKMIKLSQDDILEVLTEYLAKENEFGAFSSKAILIGTPGSDLRLVAIIGELEDERIKNTVLEEADKTLEFNGPHSFIQEIDESKFADTEIDDC